MLSLIVALDRNGVIGKQGRLPWHLPADLKRFRKLTMGHTVIMGRRTFESLGSPLPGRRNIVLSRSREFSGAEVARSLEEARRIAGPDEEVFVIGGAEVFREALPQSDRMYVTRVETEVQGGDVRFPVFEPGEWRIVHEEAFGADDENPYPTRYLIYERISGG